MSLLPLPGLDRLLRKSQRSGRHGAPCRVAGLVVALSLLALATPARPESLPEGTSESQQKARLICNFLRNCKWPERRFPTGDSPFIIGIYGSDHVGEYLRENIQDRRVQGRPVVIRRISLKEELSSCHLVFVSRSERDRLRGILAGTRRENVLTVGETDNFIASGGIIQFTISYGQVRYHVSLDAARRERIEPNGFVLRMAVPQSSARGPAERRIAESP